MRFNYGDGRVPYSMEYIGQTYYLLYDQIGSLRAVVDSSGLVVKRVDYDSFGNVILDTDPSFKVPFGFAGGLYDPDTGLVRFGARDYAPLIGRWTAKDPIDFGGGSVNLYEYVENDPVNLFDPWGLVNWRKLISGLGELASGIAGVAVAATTETGSVGTATAVSISVAAFSAPAISKGVTDIILAIMDKKNKILSPDPISLGSYICTEDINVAERNKYYFDLFTSTTRTFELMTKSSTAIEETEHLINLFNIQYESYSRAVNSKR